MLIFRREERDALFSKVRCLVVDELHAFAGDFRGWHLLAVTERLVKVTGHDLQRLGLSATLGNPEHLLGWLAGSSPAPRRVIAPPAPPGPPPDLCLDYVGGLQNAAVVISRLHRGEKRLVFCDSRSRVEQLAGVRRRRVVAAASIVAGAARQDHHDQEQESTHGTLHAGVRR
jgi:ATP-dependent Lhr-like helicase